MDESSLEAAFIPALHKPTALLPIAKHRTSILYLVETFPVTIVVGQTGSGKSTQIPQFLENAGWCTDGKVIGVTQVRKFIVLLLSVSILMERLRLAPPCRCHHGSYESCRGVWL
jgi:ATP-dependent RNA helicase DDX35